MAASLSADGGIVFREVETVETGDPPSTVREVRQVFADGASCKVLFEESNDPLIPAGSYLLATGADAFIIDPGTRTVAPLEPANMQPVIQSPEARGNEAVRVTLERELDEPGPTMLGLSTRHYVYRLGFRQEGARDIVARQEERHEFWATPLAPGEPAPAAWQALRAADDGGRGPLWREAREAIEQLLQHGLVLRQIIERRGPDGERVLRDVTALSRASLAPEIFSKPMGYTQSEFLAPAPGSGANGANEQGGSVVAPE